MKKEKLVSIIIPTYNRPTTLDRAIDTCLKQTYQNIEIIVVDDNDKESIHRKETEELMSKYKNNSKIVYIKMPNNGGACKARNEGIKQAHGFYITFLDDDDVFYPKNVEQKVKYMQFNKLDMMFSDIEYFNDVTNVNYIHSYKDNFDLTRKGLLRKALVDVISGSIGFMYKKSVLDEIGGFYDIPASQEYILFLKTVDKGYKIGYSKEVGAKWYSHDGNSGITGSLKAIEAKKTVKKLVKPLLNNLSIADRRKVMYRLNAFIFIQYLRRKDKRCIKYGFYLLPYLDLLILSRFNKKKIIDGYKYN